MCNITASSWSTKFGNKIGSPCTWKYDSAQKMTYQIFTQRINSRFLIILHLNIVFHICTCYISHFFQHQKVLCSFPPRQQQMINKTHKRIQLYLQLYIHTRCQITVSSIAFHIKGNFGGRKSQLKDKANQVSLCFNNSSIWVLYMFFTSSKSSRNSSASSAFSPYICKMVLYR